MVGASPPVTFPAPPPSRPRPRPGPSNRPRVCSTSAHRPMPHRRWSTRDPSLILLFLGAGLMDRNDHFLWAAMRRAGRLFARSATGGPLPRRVPCVEVLEDRTTPSTAYLATDLISD